MIRPFTCVCFLLACGSGLYLYQAKHRVQVLDRRDREDGARHRRDCASRRGVLHAEWTLLNDPQRLQALADQLLDLKTVTPGQFTSMADLDSRLPAVRGAGRLLPVRAADGAESRATDPQPEEPAPTAARLPPKPLHRGDRRRPHRRVLPTHKPCRPPSGPSRRGSASARNADRRRAGVGRRSPRPRHREAPAPGSARTRAGVRFRARDGAGCLASAAGGRCRSARPNGSSSAGGG